MTQSASWKIATVVLSALCAALAYRVFDQGISRTYLDAGQQTTADNGGLLAALVENEWRGMTDVQVMQRLSAYAAAQPSGSIVLKKDEADNSIYLEGVRFDFMNGRLSKVAF
jgi:hypothetical protein